MNLTHLGWGDDFSAAFEQTWGHQGLQPARVVREERGIYQVSDGAGEYLAQVSGKFRHEAACESDFPAVGDWVAMAASTW